MKSKFLLTILLLITTVSLFSFTNAKKLAPKNKESKFFTCAVVLFGLITRSGSYVSIPWTGPNNAYYTYFGYTKVTGTSFSGKTYSTQITIRDNNEGGTITVTSHCTDSTTSSGTHASW